MHTDGVIEAADRDHQEFGSKCLAATIERLHQCTPKEMIRGIREGLEDLGVARPLADDTTVVVRRGTQQVN